MPLDRLDVQSTGITLDATRKYKAEVAEPKPGEHLWVVVAMFKVVPTGQRMHLDMESLLSIEGPGCFVCEAPYSQAADTPCPGAP